MLSRLEEKDKLYIYSIIEKEFNVKNYQDNVYTNWYIYKDNDEIIGFINYDVIYDKSEIEYIYVFNNYRKMGIATKLLSKMIDDLNEKNIHNITLEVKSSNKEAINFYKKNKFSAVAIREKYYGNEDAILMMRSW